MSRHHWKDVIKRIAMPIINKVGLLKWNHFTNPEVRIKAPIDPINGHGLWSTKWKEWFLLFIINTFQSL